MSNLKKNFIYLFTGNLVYAICQWGMLVVYAKMGSPEVVGKFSLASAIVSPILMFTNLQLKAMQATEVANKYTLDDFMAVRVISIGVAFVVTALVGLGCYRNDGILSVLAILVMAKGIEALNDVLYGYFQKHEGMGFIAQSMAIKGILSLAILACAFYFSKNLAISLLALFLVWFGRMLFFDFPWLTHFEMGKYIYHGVGEFCSRIMKVWTTRNMIMREILKSGTYLGVALGLISLNSSVPRFIVNKFLGERELGFFSAIVYTSVAINVFVMSVGNATSPRLARLYFDGDKVGFLKVLFRNLEVVLAFGVLALLTVFFFGPQLLTIMYTREYAAYNPVFFLAVLAMTIFSVASMLGFSLIAIKSYAEQVPIFIAVLVANVALCYLLIPMVGLIGAVWGMVGSYLMQAILSIVVVIRKLNTGAPEVSRQA